MIYDLQKASFWKRISAWLFDGILTNILAVGLALVLSMLLGYDTYDRSVEDAYARYEAQYGITFDISQETYLEMSEEDRTQYDAAYAALTADEEAMYAYNMMLNLSLVILSLGILAAILIWEFMVPLFLGNGQTLGKKIFSIGLVRNDGVQVNTMQLFTRTLLGKFTIETMIPVYILVMLFWGMTDVTGTMILAALLVVQCCILGFSRTNALIHDLLAGTVVVDISSQMIFRTTEDLIAYKKKIHAEMVSRRDY